jgi:hypothetical protein
VNGAGVSTAQPLHERSGVVFFFFFVVVSPSASNSLVISFFFGLTVQRTPPSFACSPPLQRFYLLYWRFSEFSLCALCSRLPCFTVTPLKDWKLTG